jgi:flagellar motor switch protein FliM
MAAGEAERNVTMTDLEIEAAFARHAAEETEAAAERILNQDEIDSLLGFSTDGAEATGQRGVHAIINSSLVSSERLPMLAIVFDRLVRLLTTSLRHLTSDNVDLAVESISSVRFGECLNTMPLPALIAVFRAEQWDNFGLCTADSGLIYSVVDVLLGGQHGIGAPHIEGRPDTTIERALIERLVEVVLKDLATAFEPLSPITCSLDRLEANPRFAVIARVASAALLVRLRIDMDGRGGCLEILMPYATLEPIRELLLQMFMGEKFGRDTIWESHLAAELWATEIQLDAVLDEQVMPLGAVRRFQLGQTLTLNTPPEASLELRCGGVPLFTGQMGQVRNQVAVQVKDVLTKGQRQPAQTS